MPGKSYKCILVDDEPDALNILEALLISYPEFRVLAKESNVDSALQSIIRYTPDLLFLDVEMPGKNGFELVSQLQSLHLDPEIIFVTAYNQYAVQAFKVAAFDYLLKPVDPDELTRALMRFKTHTRSREMHEKISILLDAVPGYRKIIFHTRAGLVLVNPQDILYCEADGNYVDVHMTNLSKLLVTRNLADIIRQLPSGQFFRINRSLVINLSYLARIDRHDQKCFLKFENQVYEFHMPARHIRQFEKGE